MSIKPAPWWPRFWAWVIDIVIIWVVTGFFFLGAFGWSWPFFGLAGLVEFVYWTALDSEGRQSIGKKALNLKQVTLKGKKPSLSASAVSAFGKSFLLVIDMIIGVLARPGKKQRLFNIASDTAVIEES
ncbi:MAG: RDD family protein [Candidatus Aenigmarchaeota archaeon]|nr:RDD family protein [Candidatus Aenigmarchaeota archaeon]